jgi:hypothetical protein
MDSSIHRIRVTENNKETESIKIWKEKLPVRFLRYVEIEESRTEKVNQEGLENASWQNMSPLMWNPHTGGS